MDGDLQQPICDDHLTVVSWQNIQECFLLNMSKQGAPALRNWNDTHGLSAISMDPYLFSRVLPIRWRAIPSCWLKFHDPKSNTIQHSSLCCMLRTYDLVDLYLYYLQLTWHDDLFQLFIHPVPRKRMTALVAKQLIGYISSHKTIMTCAW